MTKGVSYGSTKRIIKGLLLLASGCTNAQVWSLMVAGQTLASMDIERRFSYLKTWCQVKCRPGAQSSLLFKNPFPWAIFLDVLTTSKLDKGKSKTQTKLKKELRTLLVMTWSLISISCFFRLPSEFSQVNHDLTQRKLAWVRPVINQSRRDFHSVIAPILGSTQGRRTWVSLCSSLCSVKRAFVLVNYLFWVFSHILV